MTNTPYKLREILERHGVVNIDTHRLELDVFEIDQAIKSIEALFSLPEKKTDEAYMLSNNMTDQEKSLLEHWDNGYNACLDEIRKRWQEVKNEDTR